MNIGPAEAVEMATRDGWRRFYFCSEACYQAFLDTLNAYVGWHAGPKRSGR